MRIEVTFGIDQIKIFTLYSQAIIPMKTIAMSEYRVFLSILNFSREKLQENAPFNFL
tara:strand:+ start:13 stop:183 length:171 start_codon:yes stop_codon:yes gene_type:complete